MSVVRFHSILSRIIFLHVIAVGVTSICMPLALYWLLSAAANDLHNGALRENADTVARYLTVRDDGGWAIELPAGLKELYSESYGRYAYAVLDSAGHVLLSSLKDGAPIFSSDSRAANTMFLETRRDNATISGASIPKVIDGRPVWIQVAEDLAHRDVLIDDIVAGFLNHVGWIT